MIFLDFSKAFDTVKHELLLEKFSKIGISNLTLNFLKSYFIGRKQQTISLDKKSDWVNILAGVPQGSITGPLFFNFYTNELPKIFLNLKCQMYADDTQLYIKCFVKDSLEIFNKINEDLNLLHNWCTSHSLIINPDKCYHLIIGSPNNINKINLLTLPNIILANNIIPRCKNARNLGVHFDEHFTWEVHVNHILKSCFNQLRYFNKHKNFLNENIKKILIQNFIIPKFDYCDIIYQHITEDLSYRLQKMQNICVRFIFNLRKYDHISSYYIKLNWLQLNQRRKLHFGCFIYKLYQTHSPGYLTGMLLSNRNIHNYNTRSGLHIPSINRTSGKKMFKFYAPQFWNSLPQSIKDASNYNTFKIQLTSYSL